MFQLLRHNQPSQAYQLEAMLLSLGNFGSETHAGLNWAVMYAPLDSGWCHSLSCIEVPDTGEKNWEQR